MMFIWWMLVSASYLLAGNGGEQVSGTLVVPRITYSSYAGHLLGRAPEIQRCRGFLI